MPEPLPPYVLSLGWWVRRTVEGRTSLAPPTRDIHLSFGGGERSNALNRIAGMPETGAYAARRRAREYVRGWSRMLDGETHSSVFPRAVARALTEVYGSSPGAAGR